MPVFFQKNENDSQILIWEICESCDELLSQLNTISTEEYNSIRTTKRKKEYLVARLALKKILGCEVNIQHHPSGQPYVSSEMHISITHSGCWLAVIVNQTHEVGIDIEVTTEKIRKLYTRFMSHREQAEFNNGENLQQLHLIWSAKEALYKIIGQTAVDFANQLYIHPFLLENTGCITAVHTVTNRHYTLYYNNFTHFSLVYCIK